MKGRPVAAYRPAGDRYVLVEYGDGDELDLRVNFFVLRALDELTADPPKGLVEAAPGFRSILVRFDPELTRRDALVDHLRALHDRVPDASSLTVRSRRIELPIAFDHSVTRQAIERYAATIRADAPYSDSNIDYIVDCNGLTDREAFYSAILGTEWWTAFTGFAPGLPFMFSLRAPTALSVPKCNPARTWTPEGAVGMGGPCVAIFPVDAPGSYQLFGRTIPIYDILGRNRAFHGDPFLIGPGDRVRFARVEEAELEEIRRLALEDRYAYRVEDAMFSVAGL
jgi:urea carboxylase